ncbi:MAG: GGDEF domain-containing protein [Actinomycetes bacterium]
MVGDDRAAARRLEALAHLARTTGSARTSIELLARAAPYARVVLDAASVSFSRWYRPTGILRTVVNEGQLGPGELARPVDEVCAVAGFPRLTMAGRYDGGHLDHRDDPQVDAAEARLLDKLGKHCSLTMPIWVEEDAWGKVRATRTADQPCFTTADLDLAATVAAQVATGLAHLHALEQAHRLAYTDPLTGLANRRRFDDVFDEAMDSPRRPVGLAVVDVNGLKWVNDAQGHQAGDRLLVDVGGLVSAAASRVGGLGARLGGDEFCVLSVGAAVDELVGSVTDLCRDAVRHGVGQGVAAGVASTEGSLGRSASPRRLFRLADAAQYRAKRSGSLVPVVAGQPPPRQPARPPPAPRSSTAGPVRSAADRGPVRVPELLAAGVAACDQAGAVGTPLRLAAVLRAVVDLADAAQWFVSVTSMGSGVLRTVDFGVARTGGSEGLANLEAEHGGVWSLAEYPASAAAVHGGGFLTVVGAADADPAEEALLLAGGYTSLLAAGACAEHTGWLAEVYSDEISRPLDAVLDAFRAVVGIAVAAGCPPTSVA